ncbi:hypothetical protein I656_01822 [Geobacillus sp. WSUCF1]|nr:hypothetical protein I656_01822 [Geobacillus sp. WSUCF1]
MSTVSPPCYDGKEQGMVGGMDVDACPYYELAHHDCFVFPCGVDGAARGGQSKIVQMVLRLFYILTIVTGLLLLHSIASISALYWLKALAGLWVIGAMEMVLAAEKKGKSAAARWTQWVIALAVTLFLGLLLPLGFDLF